MDDFYKEVLLKAMHRPNFPYKEPQCQGFRGWNTSTSISFPNSSHDKKCDLGFEDL